MRLCGRRRWRTGVGIAGDDLHEVARMPKDGEGFLDHGDVVLRRPRRILGHLRASERTEPHDERQRACVCVRAKEPDLGPGRRTLTTMALPAKRAEMTGPIKLWNW